MEHLLGDVGGQKTLRTYWKNYFEKTDTLIWVVDSTDRERLTDCQQELHGLLLQEVSIPDDPPASTDHQAASYGSIFAHLQEQERRRWIYDRGRNP